MYEVSFFILAPFPFSILPRPATLVSLIDLTEHERLQGCHNGYPLLGKLYLFQGRAQSLFLFHRGMTELTVCDRKIP